MYSVTLDISLSLARSRRDVLSVSFDNRYMRMMFHIIGFSVARVETANGLSGKPGSPRWNHCLGTEPGRVQTRGRARLTARVH